MDEDDNVKSGLKGLKNAGRPKRMGHNTRKSMGAVLCVVRRHEASSIIVVA